MRSFFELDVAQVRLEWTSFHLKIKGRTLIQLPSGRVPLPDRVVAESDEHAVKGPTSPIQPRKAEMEKHLLRHLPFRSWCPACLAGRAEGAPHYCVATMEGLVVMQIDFFYVTTEGEEDKLTCFCIMDCSSGAIGACGAPSKGLSSGASVEYALQVLAIWGNKDLVLHSDGENVIVAAARKFGKVKKAARCWSRVRGTHNSVKVRLSKESKH